MTSSVPIKHRRPANSTGGGPQPFQTDKQIVTFANRFLRDRARGFKKDIDICLTGKKIQGERQTHAYMPALLLCFSFFDLLSGLYTGNIKGHRIREFQRYMHDFMPPNRYNVQELEILYVGFRHKIAHLSHPYLVLDTAKEKNISGASKRVAWKIYASRRKAPLELVQRPTAKNISSHPTPWPVPYDHVLEVSIPMLAVDARKSLDGTNGYIAKLRADRQLRKNFVDCMKVFHPQ